MTRITLREKNIQVEAEDDGSILVGKCETYDNFDDHGADYELPLADADEARTLATLLTQAADAMERLAGPVGIQSGGDTEGQANG